MSSTLRIVLINWVVDTECDTGVSIVVNFVGSTFYVDVANFLMEMRKFFLSAGSCRGEGWSLIK